MKDIKYRGIAVYTDEILGFEKGQQVIGSLLIEGDNYFIKPFDMEDWVIVDPTTVCLYTGYTNADGIELFEGDHLVDTTTDKDFIIAYRGGSFLAVEVPLKDNTTWYCLSDDLELKHENTRTSCFNFKNNGFDKFSMIHYHTLIL